MLWYKLVDIKLNKTKQLFDEIDLIEKELETDLNLFKNLLNEDLNNNKLKLLIQKICIKKCIQNSEISISYICQNKNYDYISKLSKKIEILKLRNLKVKKIIYDEKYFGKLSYGVLNRLISTLATEEKIKEITSNNKILTKSYYMKK